MAKTPSSVLGIDIGRHAIKSVLLRRKGARIHLSKYAITPLERPLESQQEYATAAAGLLALYGQEAKRWSISLAHPEAVIRIVEQPETSREMLREAVRLSGESLLNQDVRHHVIDCAPVRRVGEEPGQMSKYLVGAVPRTLVSSIAGAFHKAPVSAVQLGPVCLFNAFEFAHEEVFANQVFMLLDIGYEGSTMLIGWKGEMVLVRSIEYGSRGLLDRLATVGNFSHREALEALEKQDALMAEGARVSLSELAREVASSIGYFEGRFEESIAHVYVSGGISSAGAIIELLAGELGRPCQNWSSFERCEVALPGEQGQSFSYDANSLHSACGAAALFFKGE